MLGVDRCCKRQALFQCHESQTECLEYSKTSGPRSGTPPLLSASVGASGGLAPYRKIDPLGDCTGRSITCPSYALDNPVGTVDI